MSDISALIVTEGEIGVLRGVVGPSQTRGQAQRDAISEEASKIGVSKGYVRLPPGFGVWVDGEPED